MEDKSLSPQSAENQIKEVIRVFEKEQISIFVVYGNVPCFDEVKEKFLEYLNKKDQKKELLHLWVDVKLARCETLVQTIIELVLHIGDQFTDRIVDSDEKNQLIKTLYVIGKFSRKNTRQNVRQAPEKILPIFQSNADLIFYPGFIPIISKYQPIVVSFAQFEEALSWSNEIRLYLLQALLDRVTEGNLRFVIFAKHPTEPRLYPGSDRESISKSITFYNLQEINVFNHNEHEYEKSTTFIILDQKIKSNEFDVFLCHNSIDKPTIKEIARRLKERGIRPWLDEWELRPGLMWQRELDKQIEHIKSAAVFAGQNGLGPWQDMELFAFLRKFVTRECPVIPVILSDCEEVPKLPTLLEGMTWVDFRKNDPDPLEQLIWGITGQRIS